ncbi:class I SAM-dependent methyltransferase [Novosphingobium sp. AP12]|uniref:class I SAM-dependent methyltransferase n=1 Tax=Novosphingobium sp. AP12 TaxID=1144305 RepID=UPI001EE67911|nr:class I SAM-dependent methyltransferase [Novosphingobium sp. AP12]
MFNAAFDPGQMEYSGRYEETQGFSPTFSQFHSQLAVDLIERHDLRGREVMEIGCGKGEFLLLLSRLGANRGVGVDPSALPARLFGVEGAHRVILIPEYFAPEHCRPEPDFLCCKMTLEHITDTASFMSTVRGGLSAQRGTIVFFQVPDANRIFKECAFEDIYHEHCSYFTESSLSSLFSSCGFRVTRIAHEYGDQYLTIEAVPAEVRPNVGVPAQRSSLGAVVDSFAQRVLDKQSYWRQAVKAARISGQKVVIWGSGSKAVSFLKMLGESELVDCVTDINPNRHGYFMPGTGHEIVSPSTLSKLGPVLIVVMNQIYEAEIRNDIDLIVDEYQLLCL